MNEKEIRLFLKKERKRQKYSREDLSLLAEVGKDTISNIENNKTIFYYDIIQKILLQLGYTLMPVRKKDFFEQEAYLEMFFSDIKLNKSCRLALTYPKIRTVLVNTWNEYGENTKELNSDVMLSKIILLASEIAYIDGKKYHKIYINQSVDETEGSKLFNFFVDGKQFTLEYDFPYEKDLIIISTLSKEYFTTIRKNLKCRL